MAAETPGAHGFAELLAAAEVICDELPLQAGFSAASVGAALRTASGAIYTGVCIDLACGLGFCAEAAAVSEMLKHRETVIREIVAVNHRGKVLAPCGRCREMIAQVDAANVDTRVLLSGDRVVCLRDLLPENWMNDKA